MIEIKPTRKFKNYLNNLKIKKQLYIVYLFAAFIPALLIGSYLIINTRKLVMKQYNTQAKADNTRVKSTIYDVTTLIKNISDEFFRDNELKDIISSKYYTKDEFYENSRRYNKFDTYLQRYTQISNIYLYVSNYSMCEYGHFRMVTDEVRKSEWYQRVVNEPEYLWMVQQSYDQGYNKLSLLRHVRKIPIANTGNFAVLVIDISNNYLKSRINSTLQTEMTVNDDTLFYTDNRKQIGRPIGCKINYDTLYYSYSGKTTYNNKIKIVQISTFIPIQSLDKIYIVTIDDKAIPNTNRITIICIAIVLICLVVPLMMVLVFTRTFSSRINTLRSEMHKVSTGNYNITEKFNGNDELYELFTELHTMIESIKRMDKQIYSERISKERLINHQQKMEFQLLSSQINPHFLYNTLETIRMKAFNADDKEVATAIKLLGKSMRYVLESSKRSAMIKSELEYIEIYLKIQKLRFHDRVNYSIEVEESVDGEKYNILPLLLQPIVENAILHGLEETESGGLIQISIKSKNNKLIICVKDNGMGISDKELANLRKKINSDQNIPKTSIGLHNINQRIKLYYGKEYGMDIKSKLGFGTTVIIFLPLNHEWGEQENEGIYSG